VTALELTEAEAALAEVGWRIARVDVTRPPRRGAGIGPARVARVRIVGEGVVEVVVVHTRYE
jgi:hypothetical protein